MGIRAQMKQLQWAAVAAVRSAAISGTEILEDILLYHAGLVQPLTEKISKAICIISNSN